MLRAYARLLFSGERKRVADRPIGRGAALRNVTASKFDWHISVAPWRSCSAAPVFIAAGRPARNATQRNVRGQRAACTEMPCAKIDCARSHFGVFMHRDDQFFCIKRVVTYRAHCRGSRPT
ncbi:hypothetical protein ALC56_03840 [Trachymyrmex septentrionalis]|uniref:Uncharacterized protein n=1 Tax=Trachymyrmex septentrionalis TaxID=34720 RepID=A0A195FN14_9HYME|nr:hypothetical protein ALC56_03840 [Trachymyrmex septentrionalis]